jgi:hypothetical protein
MRLALGVSLLDPAEDVNGSSRASDAIGYRHQPRKPLDTLCPAI